MGANDPVLPQYIMKALIPHSSHISTTDKKIVLGGVEKFIYDLLTSIKGVILG
jgi:hypothetical protein